MKQLQELAEFIASLAFEDMPQEVVERAQWVVRDTIGVIIGGMAEPEVRALADHTAKTTPGNVPLLGHSGATTIEWASFVHGTAGTTLEMDEGHAFARGHAAVHALPPALALAAAGGVDPKSFLTGFVAGYEVAARAGVATRLRPPVHPFGAWGVLGAAAATTWFRRFAARDVHSTLELAASYAITPSFASAFQGANVRNTFAGTVNQLGVRAADLYTLGFRGQQGALATTFGEILGEHFDAAALSDDLGSRFEIMRGYFKPYSACRYTHAAVDAVLKLRAEQHIPVEQVVAAEVATYDIASRLREPAPETALAGRFSLPFVVAATLVNGSAGPEIFREEVLQDAQVRSLAQKVQVVEDAAFTALTPARRPARVSFTLADGRQLSATMTGSKGDPDRPMSAAELAQKFEGLVAPVLGREQTQLAWHRLGHLTESASLPEITSVLQQGGAYRETRKNDVAR